MHDYCMALLWFIFLPDRLMVSRDSRRHALAHNGGLPAMFDRNALSIHPHKHGRSFLRDNLKDERSVKDDFVWRPWN